MYLYSCQILPDELRFSADDRLRKDWEGHPILDHPVMTRLGRVHQLGQIRWAFEQAKHTRLEHSIDAARETGEALPDIALLGRYDFPHAELVIQALLHDGGTPPKGHVVEYELQAWTGMDHKQRMLTLYDTREDPQGLTLRDRVARMDHDPDIVGALLAKEHWAHTIVTDDVLGADKRSYSKLDAHYMGVDQQAPDEERVRSSLGWDPLSGRPAIKMGAIDDSIPTSRVRSMLVQRQRLHTEVYFSWRSLLAGRLLQRALHETILRGVDPETVWDLDDDGLMRTLEETVADTTDLIAYRHLRSGTPFDPRSPVRFGHTLTWKHAGRRYAAQPIDGTTHEVEPSFLTAMVTHYQDPHRLQRLEEKLSGMGFTTRICLSPAPYKLVPKDIPILDGNGEPYTTLKRADPGLYMTAQAIAEEHAAVRFHSFSRARDISADGFSGELLGVVEKDMRL